jgi:catechol 2,3-dioxygenase-like lactoylglutathione lyase family enzyme
MSNNKWILSLAALTGVIGPVAAQPPSQPEANPQQLMYVAINVKDFEKSRDFYLRVVGLKENPGSTPIGTPVQSSSLSFSGTYNDSFLMISHERDKPVIGAGALARITFKVADIQGIVERARSGGYVVQREPASAHGIVSLLVAVIEDPDGNPVELVHMGP